VRVYIRRVHVHEYTRDILTHPRVRDIWIEFEMDVRVYVRRIHVRTLNIYTYT